MKGENPAVAGGAPNGSAKNQAQITSRFAEWPRPVREIRDDLVRLAHDASASGDPVDSVRLDVLADELAWCASIAKLYGGSSTATEAYEAATR